MAHEIVQEAARLVTLGVTAWLASMIVVFAIMILFRGR